MHRAAAHRGHRVRRAVAEESVSGPTLLLLLLFNESVVIVIVSPPKEPNGDRLSRQTHQAGENRQTTVGRVVNEH